MRDTVTAMAKSAWQGVVSLGRGVRRGVIATCAVVAMVVIYGLGSIGSYGLSLAGISTLALTTSATQAEARKRRRRRRRGYRRRRRRGWGLWFGPRRRRRRRWRGRRRRRRGIYLYW
jgi:hypothetical protein